MKKKSSEDLDDDLRPHYDYHFSKMKPNRFGGMQLSAPIYLDDDVAEVFDSSEAVNTVLRSAIRAMRSAGAKRSQKANSIQEARLVKAAASRRTPKAVYGLTVAVAVCPPSVTETWHGGLTPHGK